MDEFVFRGAGAPRFRVDDATEITSHIDAANASLVTIRLTGEHGRRLNSRSDKLLYVLSGLLTLEIDGQAYSLRPGDAAMIGACHVHALTGRIGCELLMVCVPGFDPAEEI